MNTIVSSFMEFINEVTSFASRHRIRKPSRRSLSLMCAVCAAFCRGTLAAHRPSADDLPSEVASLGRTVHDFRYCRDRGSDWRQDARHGPRCRADASEDVAVAAAMADQGISSSSTASRFASEFTSRERS